VYIYIYIYRERERDRDRCIDMSPLVMFASPFAALVSLPTWLYVVRLDICIYVYICIDGL